MSDIAIVIDEISKKLGVAASEIYAVLQAQAKLQTAKSLILCLLCIFTIVFTCAFFKKSFFEKRNNGKTAFEYHYNEDDGGDYFLIIGAAALFAISIILLVVLICELGTLIDCVFNPKYWALNRILSH